MSGVPQQPDENDASYRLDRLAGLTIVGSIVLSLILVTIGEPLFWVPFAAGIGIGLPTFAILADRERDRASTTETGAAGTGAAGTGAAGTGETETEAGESESTESGAEKV